MTASEGRRRHKLYQRARRRWAKANPARKFELTELAVYVAPVELWPAPRESEGPGDGG